MPGFNIVTIKLGNTITFKKYFAQRHIKIELIGVKSLYEKLSELHHLPKLSSSFSHIYKAVEGYSVFFKNDPNSSPNDFNGINSGSYCLHEDHYKPYYNKHYHGITVC